MRMFNKEAMVEAIAAIDKTDNAAEVVEMEAKRRAIRKKQSDMLDDMIKKNDELLEIDNGAWENYCEENNKMLSGIVYTREALGDVRTVSTLIKNVHTKAIRLDDNSRRLNFKDFAICLKGLFKGRHQGDDDEQPDALEDDGDAAVGPSKRKRSREVAIRDDDGGGPFDWCALGADVGTLFTTTIPATMMFGPLGKPPKVRVAPERVARPVADNSRVEVAEEVVQDEEDEEDGEATKKNLTKPRLRESTTRRKSFENLETKVRMPSSYLFWWTRSTKSRRWRTSLTMRF